MKCPDCKGSKKDTFAKEMNCLLCDGTGEVTKKVADNTHINPAVEGFSQLFYAVTFDDKLREFVKESNEIEGICEKASHQDAYDRLKPFLKYKRLTVKHLCKFNTAGDLRLNSNQNVRIGNYYPPPGGQHIETKLKSILKSVNAKGDPFKNHIDFETLHPFMDGNGRTGRAVWLWQMVNQFHYELRYGFLQTWYYQSFNFYRR